MLLLAGLGTRFAAVPLLAVISVAIATAKLPMLVRDGFRMMAHEGPMDGSMLLGLLSLLTICGGRSTLGYSVDSKLDRFTARSALHAWPAVRPRVMVTVAVVPTPSTLVNAMAPPWAVTILRAMLSPNPVPPNSRLRALSTR
jgi:hypothetical protein